MPDSVHFARQWGLLRKLTARASQWTLRELAREFSVSTKTIQRDLRALQDVGFHLKSITSAHGEKAWRIETEEIIAGLSLTFEEITALYLGRRFLEPLAGTPFWEGAQSAFKKLKIGVGKSQSDYLDKFASTFYQTSVGQSDYSGRGELIDTLMICIEDLKIVDLTYHKLVGDQPERYAVHPLGLIHHDRSLYLVAFTPIRDDYRMYKVDRIIEALNTGKDFIRPSDFKLNSYVESAFGIFGGGERPRFDVRIRFASCVAKYIQEHRWHHSQRITTNPDGSLTVEFALAALEEVKAWILSFGSKAVVESPPELRRMVRLDLLELLRHYPSE